VVGWVACGCSGVSAQGQKPEGRLVVAVLHGAVQVDAATDAIVWQDFEGRFQSEPAAEASPLELEGGLTWRVDGAAIYVADEALSVWEGGQERVVSADIGGSKFAPRPTRELLVDADAAYLAQQTSLGSTTMSLVQVDLKTGTPLPLVEDRPLFGSLAQDADSLFFVESPFRVARVDKSGASGDVTLLDEAELSRLFPGERTPQPSKIVTDAEHVYLTINNQNGAPVGGVVEVDKASGAVTVLARDELNPLGIAVDSTHVYYTRNDAGAGAVVRIPKQGGEPEVVATRQLDPVQVVLTLTAVYWTNLYGEQTDPPAKYPELRSIPKP
jgi:hypothetical protein